MGPVSTQMLPSVTPHDHHNRHHQPLPTHYRMSQPTMMLSRLVPPHSMASHSPQHQYYNGMMPTVYAVSYMPFVDADSDVDEDSASAVNRRELKERWLEQERAKNESNKAGCSENALYSISSLSLPGMRFCCSGYGVVAYCLCFKRPKGEKLNQFPQQSHPQNAKRVSDMKAVFECIPAFGGDSGTESNTASTSSSSSRDDEAPISRFSRPISKRTHMCHYCLTFFACWNTAVTCRDNNRLYSFLQKYGITCLS